MPPANLCQPWLLTLPDPNQNELKNWARDEIERNRHVKDHNHIKYLLSVSAGGQVG